KPAGFDADEPRRVGESVATMGLRYATVTGVARDDLPDGGAWLYAETVRQIHKLVPGCGVELLIPDFNGEPDLLAEVFGAAPEVRGPRSPSTCGRPRGTTRWRAGSSPRSSWRCARRPSPPGSPG